MSDVLEHAREIAAWTRRNRREYAERGIEMEMAAERRIHEQHEEH